MSIPSKDHDRLVIEWQRWRATLAEAMDKIHDALEASDYLTASLTMDIITQQQAQMSVMMTRVLIKHGILKEE